MKPITALMLSALLATATAASAETGGAPVGLVKNTTGDATIVREGRRIDARPGSELLLGDRLSTGATGTMGVILRDDTIISLGPSTETTIEQFAFKPAEQKLGIVVKVARGVIGYLSGKISKLSPGSVRIETPVATLGVRGTHFIARIEP